jgi:hypothetical protein
MGVLLPNGEYAYIPSIPKAEELADPHKLHDFLQSLKRAIEENASNNFNNKRTIIAALNSGTSGTFALSSGGSIIITSGVVITVTS